MLKDKKILLGITGSIAAYKAAILLRLLVKEGAQVQVLITPAGKEFITPVTLSALSGKPVESDFFGTTDGSWHSHVDMGLWADLMLIAPCSANTLGKLANGIADNLLLTTYLSAKCPVLIAPAMDLDMYKHPAIQKNIDILRSFGNHIIEPATGELASGLCGKGRMEEPENILEMVKGFFQSGQKLIGKKFLVTAGPTYENIDPVRFIGNYSTGKMGYAIAETLANQGAEVVLISGPTSLPVSHPSVSRIDVVSAKHMYETTIKHFPNMDGAIMTAAVADFTPIVQEKSKVKRGKENYSIELKPTQDIAAQLGKMKKPTQHLVGFALETDNELENARKKLTDKNLDFIVLNSLNDEGAGFGHDTNKISILDKNNNISGFELKTKADVAVDIVEKIVDMMRP
ncbi:MAG: bifunctional phosphopantothenoylcysteine decarboxylase/phosphopantothenate--cysteine ligase CoaBC [Bacteroidales bacterium]|nr:bifunctional phosphopantothenoylcysteine decarboxylase/phosphopantothenate--cysteine ligase CoaBC [Bacteroidales bacterium]MCF8456799.1 bifunctional phosphopantothenoylcysteine decarboxylase/phosphopantothenate--cysteine ligase CoaBC [Bacteroidales bacterium]